MTVFREILGFGPEQVASQLAAAESFLDSCPSGFSAGLSPHAPYSVHPELLRRLVGLSRDRQVPLAMHVAETRDERQLLRDGTGPLREMLESFGVWRDGVLSLNARPLDSLRVLVESSRALVVHGNYLDDEECEFLASHANLSLVYCPRTHRYFGHVRHPWRDVRQCGGRVALGTDSRASNPDLSLWNELLFLRREYADETDVDLLQLATINGAHALGINHTSGSLTSGKVADLAVVSLDSREGGLFGETNRLSRVMVAGIWQ